LRNAGHGSRVALENCYRTLSVYARRWNLFFSTQRPNILEYSYTFPLLPQILGLPGGEPEKIEQAHQKIATVLKFFENLLGVDAEQLVARHRPYFGSQNLTLAEVVAGTVIPGYRERVCP
jgi:hypothetical protein